MQNEDKPKNNYQSQGRNKKTKSQDANKLQPFFSKLK